MKLSDIRQMEVTAFGSDGKIHYADAKAIADKAKTEGEKAAVLQQLQGDAFDLTPAQRKELEKELGGKLPNNPGIVGKTLGSLNDGTTQGFDVDVTVRKSFGPPEGFDNKMQALAAARMSGSDRAVVVEYPPGRFQAVETNLRLDAAKGFSVRDGLGEVIPQQGSFNPAYADGLRQAVTKAEQAQPRDTAAVNDAWKKLASYTFGVPEDQINVITAHDQRVAGKINVNIGSHGEDGQTGRPKSDSSAFDPKSDASAVEVNAIAFRTGEPEHAQAVLFHEGTHVHNNHRAHQLYDAYSAKHAKGDDFSTWADKQVKAGKVSAEDAAIAKGLVGNDTRNDEASAYVSAFMAAFRAHPDGATAVRMADELLGAGQKAASSGNPDADFQKLQFKKLQDFYKTLPQDQRAEFDQAIAKMKQAQKGTWIAKFNYDKF